MKCTRQSNRDELLFDLASDPEELADLTKTAQNMRAIMIERLADALIEADDQARGALVGARTGSART